MADVHSLSIIALRTLSLRRIDYRCHVAYYCFTDLHTMSLVTSYLLRGAHQEQEAKSGYSSVEYFRIWSLLSYILLESRRKKLVHRKYIRCLCV